MHFINKEGVDLVSASTRQMKKCFSLIYVDANDKEEGTYRRIGKDSFYWYKKVIELNGEELKENVKLINIHYEG